MIRLQVADVTTALDEAYAAVSEAEAETLLWKSKAADAFKIAAAAEAALAAAVVAKAALEVEVLRYEAIAKKAKEYEEMRAKLAAMIPHKPAA